MIAIKINVVNKRNFEKQSDKGPSSSISRWPEDPQCEECSLLRDQSGLLFLIQMASELYLDRVKCSKWIFKTSLSYYIQGSNLLMSKHLNQNSLVHRHCEISSNEDSFNQWAFTLTKHIFAKTAVSNRNDVQHPKDFVESY